MNFSKVARSVICVSLSILFAPVLALSQDEPPPLPAHGIEGSGGIFATYCAYLVNPAKEGEIFGLPSVAFTYVNFGHSRDLNAFTITETLWDRVELGYGYDRFNTGDLPEAIARAGLAISDDYVGLHNFNIRGALLKENDFDQPWVPAVTLGVHYKYNDTVDDMNDDLGGVLRNPVGIEDNDGVDFTLYASKTVPIFERPVIFNLGLRESEAAHIGLLGFTGDYDLTVEGSVAALVTDHILVGGEYRMKPNSYNRIPGLVGEEDDWWTLCLGFIVTKNLCIDFGYGHFGQILNHEANGSWGARVKWEF